jgi:hypothetical protein
MLLTLEDSLSKWYPFPPIRGHRMTRLEETDLGPFQLDGQTAEQLIADSIGVFVSGCPDMDYIKDKLNRLAHTRFPARWLAILPTRQLAEAWHRELLVQPQGWKRSPVPAFWEDRNVTYTWPDCLDTYRRADQAGALLAGILLIDPACDVHQDRGPFAVEFELNERAGRIARFRERLGRREVLPPFVLLTRQPAKSIDTQRMLTAYGLQAWWFVDGRRLRVGEPLGNSGSSWKGQPPKLAI